MTQRASDLCISFYEHEHHSKANAGVSEVLATSVSIVNGQAKNWVTSTNFNR